MSVSWTLFAAMMLTMKMGTHFQKKSAAKMMTVTKSMLAFRDLPFGLKESPTLSLGHQKMDLSTLGV